MQPPSPLDPDQMARYVAAKAARDEEIGRKKAFWLRMIWISLIGSLLPAAAAFVITVIRMMSVFRAAGGAGKLDQAAMEAQAAAGMITMMIGMTVSGLVFVFLIVAVVRFFTLPSRKARMMSQGL